MSGITESRMRQLLTQIQDAGLSARRINLALLVLKMILRTAVRRRFLREDPTEHVRSLREPKTASSVRDIDLFPAVTDALKAQKARQAAERLKRGRGAPETGQDYVFTGPEGGLPNVNALRDRVWYPALTKAGLSRRTMYQTRHTFASNALAAGEAPSWVAAMLGHASPEMLFRVYARYIPNRKRQDGSALMRRMEGTETAAKPEAEAAAVLAKYSR